MIDYILTQPSSRHLITLLLRSHRGKAPMSTLDHLDYIEVDVGKAKAYLAHLRCQLPANTRAVAFVRQGAAVDRFLKRHPLCHSSRLLLRREEFSSTKLPDNLFVLKREEGALYKTSEYYGRVGGGQGRVTKQFNRADDKVDLTDKGFKFVQSLVFVCSEYQEIFPEELWELIARFKPSKGDSPPENIGTDKDRLIFKREYFCDGSRGCRRACGGLGKCLEGCEFYSKKDGDLLRKKKHAHYCGFAVTLRYTLVLSAIQYCIAVISGGEGHVITGELSDDLGMVSVPPSENEGRRSAEPLLQGYDCILMEGILSASVRKTPRSIFNYAVAKVRQHDEDRGLTDDDRRDMSELPSFSRCVPMLRQLRHKKIHEVGDGCHSEVDQTEILELTEKDRHHQEDMDNGDDSLELADTMHIADGTSQVLSHAKDRIHRDGEGPCEEQEGSHHVDIDIQEQEHDHLYDSNQEDRRRESHDTDGVLAVEDVESQLQPRRKRKHDDIRTRGDVVFDDLGIEVEVPLLPESSSNGLEHERDLGREGHFRLLKRWERS